MKKSTIFYTGIRMSNFIVIMINQKLICLRKISKGRALVWLSGGAFACPVSCPRLHPQNCKIKQTLINFQHRT